jgi:Domain found in Dishevelled, Egl-10, and Pleckstrin (DEP)
LNTNVLLALPHEAAHKSARALVMALGLIPKTIVDETKALSSIATQLEGMPKAVALIDLASLPKAFANVLDLANQLPLAVRARVILLRHEQGPVWDADRAWIKELGFADLFAELDAQAILAAPDDLPALIARLTQTPPLSVQQLGSFFAAMSTQPDPLTLRGMIRAHCGMDAETLARAMLGSLKSIDRSYHLKAYHACFLGTEAVSWLRKRFGCSAAIAEQLGQALLKLGLMHHVAHEHAFENQDFFYRIDATLSSSTVRLGGLVTEMLSEAGLAIKDRNYLGTNYPACWVGSEAVDWLHNKKKLPRHEAENLLNRAMSFGLILHVTNEHRVKDGNYFYRFV